MKNLNLLFAFLIIGLMATSCKKDEKTLEEQRMDFVSGTEWVASKMMLDTDNDGTTDTDVMPSMDDCEKDNFIKFDADGTFVIDEGATKCNPASSQIELEGTWTFVEESSAISLFADNEITVLTINELTEDTFTFTFIADDELITATYVAQ